jgi:hypothetical protein
VKTLTLFTACASLCGGLQAVAQPPSPPRGDADQPREGREIRQQRLIMLRNDKPDFMMFRGQGDGDVLPDMVRQMLRDLPEVRPEEFLEFCRQHFPEAIEQVRRLLNAHRPEVALDHLRRMGREFAEMRESQRRDPELFKLRMEIQQMERASHEMAQDCRPATDDQQRAQISTTLEELLGKIFDAKQSFREKKAAHIEKPLKQLRENTAARATSQSAIVKSHLDELTGKREKFES